MVVADLAQPWDTQVAHKRGAPPVILFFETVSSVAQDRLQSMVTFGLRPLTSVTLTVYDYSRLLFLPRINMVSDGFYWFS